jgi:hypothetical protein
MSLNDILELQSTLIDIVVKNQRYLDMSLFQIQDFAEIIADKALLYRFLWKHKDKENAEIAILSHLDWRLNENIVELNLGSVDEGVLAYLSKGLYRFGPTDVKARPVSYITPKHFIPNSTKEVELFKSSILLVLEILRKWIMILDKEHVKQALVVLDLKEFGMSNMVSLFYKDFELIPIIYDIFKHQYPQILGQCLVLNYGWLHAGIWSILKRMLSEEAKSKLVFLSYNQLVDYIPIDNLPVGKFK